MATHLSLRLVRRIRLCTGSSELWSEEVSARSCLESVTTAAFKVASLRSSGTELAAIGALTRTCRGPQHGMFLVGALRSFEPKAVT